MNMMQSIGCAVGIFLLFSGAAFSNEGGKDIPGEVGLSFTQAGLERSWWFGEEESPLEWRCCAVLFIPDRWGFWNLSNTEWQFMEAVDSTGRELSPVRFDLGRMAQSRDSGFSYVEIVGIAPSFPSPGAEWVRLKGLLRVPVARIMDSPVYALPLRKGASVLIPLPGGEKKECGEVGGCGGVRRQAGGDALFQGFHVEEEGWESDPFRNGLPGCGYSLLSG